MRKNYVVMTLVAQMVPAFFGLAHAAPCVVPPLSEQAISRFKANPTAIIAPNTDTRTLEARVRELAGTSAALAADLVRVAQGTTPRFQTAIAAGLAQAAVACNNVDQHAALLIQQAVAGFDDGQFQASFAAVAGDLSTAAINAAATSANGAVGSVVVTNPNTSSSSTTTPVASGGFTALVQITANAPTSSPSSSSPSTTTTAASPVSPTR
jgi:hypothetical protein